MKFRFSIVLMFVFLSGFSQTETFHDFYGKTITGDNLDFSTFRGKKVMVVNTASYCSWVYQYETLESLYTQYKDSNFTIIGFPCNDFNDQEPGSDSTINEFCQDIYGIDFQMMSKVTITHDTAEVYKWLMQKSRNGVANKSVIWNFNKFLIDEAGHWVDFYTNLTEPFDTNITNWLKTPSVLPPDTIDTLTGIREPVTPEINVSVSSGIAHVSFSKVQNQQAVIRLFSSSGQLLSKVYDGILHENEIINIDVSRFRNSLYFLQLESRGANKVFRVALIE